MLRIIDVNNANNQNKDIEGTTRDACTKYFCDGAVVIIMFS